MYRIMRNLPALAAVLTVGVSRAAGVAHRWWLCARALAHDSQLGCLARAQCLVGSTADLPTCFSAGGPG